MASVRLYLTGKLIRGTYTWLSSKLSLLWQRVGLEKITSHSLRHGGASPMSNVQTSLIDIRNLGDWRSLSVLLYLTRSLESKIEFDREICEKLFV